MNPRGQGGSIAVVQAAVLLVVVALGGIAALDVGALLRAARVATAAADGAALAASTASRPVSATLPRAAAERVARAHGATLAACECGAPRAHVTVTLPVTTRLLDHFGVTEVRATATADLVPTPTPTPSRAHPAASPGPVGDVVRTAHSTSPAAVTGVRRVHTPSHRNAT